ncbi:MAG: hypothetical protein ACNA8L_03390 [Luteolibacter sp.]|jgi:hypothetical protein
MARSREKGSSTASKAAGSNRKRTRKTLQETLKGASDRAHDRANRRIAPPGQRKSIQSVMRASTTASRHQDDFEEDYGILKSAMRIAIGLLLLPFAWITMWTFFSRLNHAAVHQDFWKASEFWHFMIGCILLTTWLLSGFFRNFFLYLYVLGHEVTHAIFVFCHLGKVSKIHVSTSGGYITTTKTNLLIALSPYFVPFYSIWVVLAHLGLRHFGVISEVWDPVFYALIGATWMFHMIWTVWMLPKDQPDLKENGTFLSLVVILLANLLVLSALMCAADANPLRSALDFAREWAIHAASFGDMAWRTANQWIEAMIEKHR